MARFPRLTAGVCLFLAASGGGCKTGRSGEGEAPGPRLSAEGAPRGGSAGEREFLEPVAAGTLTVWPIAGGAVSGLGPFSTLKEAQDRGEAVVREVGQGEEQVNQLVIENRGATPILVCGGTVVKGGNQDRQIAQDFVIAPGTQVPVDAFCIEAGRWTEMRAGFATGGVFEAKEFVTALAARASAQYDLDQEKVWEGVAGVNLAASKSPATGTFLEVVEETDPRALRAREDLKKAVQDHFRTCREKGKPPLGFAYAVGGRPVTVRTFAHPDLFEKQFGAFLEAMSLEADLAREGGGGASPPAKPASLEALKEMMRSIDQAEEQVRATTASNRNGVRVSEAGGNLNCYVEAPSGSGEKTLIPLTQDWTRK